MAGKRYATELQAVKVLTASHRCNFSSRDSSFDTDLRVLILYLRNRHRNLCRELNACSGAASPGRPQAARASEVHLLGPNLPSPCTGFRGCGPSSLLPGCEHHPLTSVLLHASCSAGVGLFVCDLRTLAKKPLTAYESSQLSSED